MKLVGYDGYGSVVVCWLQKKSGAREKAFKKPTSCNNRNICRLKTHAEKLPVGSPVDCYCRFENGFQMLSGIRGAAS